MKKVVAFIGSPRKEGNTATLVKEIVRGAQEKGAETKIYNLNDMSIKGCQSCGYCRGAAGCSIKDDMQAVYEDIKYADAVVIGSPVYMFQVTAQTKQLFDRLFPLMDVNFQPRFGIKKTIMVYAQGNPDTTAFKTAFDTNATVLSVLGLQVADTILVANANDQSTAKNSASLLAQAYQAGKDLIS